MSSAENDLVVTPRLDRLLTAARRTAVELGHPHLGVEHVVYAILGDPRSVPTQMLARHLDVDVLRGELEVFLTSPSYAPRAE